MNHLTFFVPVVPSLFFFPAPTHKYFGALLPTFKVMFQNSQNRHYQQGTHRNHKRYMVKKLPKIEVVFCSLELF